MSLDELLKHKGEELRHRLGLPLGHPVSKGDLSEAGWIRFLEGFLPNRYSVSSGFVFDSKGGVSDQIDIIVFDAFHSPLIYEADNGEKYITAESVYAVFEVKQEANKQSIEYANSKVASVLEMERTSRPMVASGNKVPARGLSRIIGGLLSTYSIAPESVQSYLASAPHLDIICSANTGLFFKSKDGIEVSHPDEAVVAFFYLLLDELFKLGTVAAIDIRDYADRALNSFSLKRGDL